MKKIQIQADDFFELLKLKEQSMWDIFAQLVKDEEQEIIFLNQQNEVLFNYTLPNNQEQLKKDQEKFTEEFRRKLKAY